MGEKESASAESARATTVKSSKSNTSERAPRDLDSPPDAERATTVKSGKSNSSD